MDEYTIDNDLTTWAKTNTMPINVQAVLIQRQREENKKREI